MHFPQRVLRCATIVWALYLTIALTAFALHAHAPDEGGAPHCALCLAQNVVGAAAVTTAFVLVMPALRWKWQLWLAMPPSSVVCAVPGLYLSRGPPVI